MKRRSVNIISIFVIFIIIIIIIIGLYISHYNKDNESYTYDSYELENMDSNLLHITPSKKCCGGAFLNDSECKNISQEDLKCTCCDRRSGLVGRPVHFEFTPISDINWKNPTCKQLNTNAKCSDKKLTPATL